MANVGVVLAGGVGNRFGDTIPKQFHLIKGKMIIEYTLQSLVRAESVDEIYIAITPGYENFGKILNEMYPKVTKIIKGGRTRTESIYNSALEIKNSNVSKVVFIDAVRPFVKPVVFNDFFKLLDQYDVIKFCSEIVDYIALTEEKFIKRIQNRQNIRLCKAPVGYRANILNTIINNIESQKILNFESDLELVLSHFPHVKIYAYESTEINIKITYKEDLILAEKLLDF